MFSQCRYLSWADKYFGQAPFNLGRSGVTCPDKPPLLTPSEAHTLGEWDTLRFRVASYNGVTINETLPALGASHAIWIAYSSLLEPGDELLIESITYEPIYCIAEGIGAKVVRFNRHSSPQFTLDPREVRKVITQRTRAVVLTNLHNPTGVRADESAIKEIASIAQAHDAYVIIDEVYAPFDSLCDRTGVWGRSARSIAPNIITIGSLSKCYGLGAHRVGWMLGPQNIIARGENALSATLSYLPHTWMKIAIRAFESLPDFARWSHENTINKREHVNAWMAVRPYLTWTAPSEGLFGFAIDHRTKEDLCPRIERGICEHGVVVVPGIFFGVPNGFRVAWSIEESKLHEALRRLALVID